MLPNEAMPLFGMRKKEKIMKKLICTVLAGTMLLTLCACGTKKTETSVTPSASPAVESTSPSSAPASPSAAAEKTLASVLDDINAHMEVGTAGSSLKAVKFAAALLDWGKKTKLSADEIKAQTVAWLSPKGNDEQLAFAEKYAAVKNAIAQLSDDNAQELLSEAGVADSNYPWNDAAFAAVKTVTEAVLGQS